MIEIVFGDSACGSLKMAQHYGSGEYNGAVGVIVSNTDGREPTKGEIRAAQEEAAIRERQAWANATPLGGDPADVFGFSLALSVGNISEIEPGIQRQHAIKKLFSVYPDYDGDDTIKKIPRHTKETLEAISSRLQKKADLRIWYSNQPDDMCGLLWLMAWLNTQSISSGQIYLVQLPQWERNDNNMPLTCWGEVSPGEWHRYLPLQRLASKEFIGECASHWRRLQQENAPVRVVLNGQLIGVSEAIYDEFITREIDAEGMEFQEVMIVGRVLGKYRLGISDNWIALRIEEMIRAGKLEAVTSSPADQPIYHRVLRKVGK